jgi:hypothetical protein
MAELKRFIHKCLVCGDVRSADYEPEPNDARFARELGTTLAKMPVVHRRLIGYNEHDGRPCYMYAEMEGRFCPKCGSHRVKSNAVVGKVSKKVCNDDCINAEGHQCSCQCGGKNHGKGHLIEYVPA